MSKWRSNEAFRLIAEMGDEFRRRLIAEEVVNRSLNDEVRNLRRDVGPLRELVATQEEELKRLRETVARRVSPPDLLVELEWIEVPGDQPFLKAGWGYCPVCWSPRSNGKHKDGCRMRAALA